MEKNDQLQRKLQLQNFLSKFIKKKEQPLQKDVDKYLERIKGLEKLSTDSNRGYMLLNHGIYSPVYVCKEFEKQSGYSLEFLQSRGAGFFFKILHIKQIASIYKVHNWAAKIRSMINENHIAMNSRIALCGLKLKDKRGKWRTILLTQKLLAFSESGEVLLSFIIFDDITYMHNSDVLWYRYSVESKLGFRTRIFFENSPKKEANELFSNREMEVLKLSAEKYGILEISERLNISKNTVERHRKNMLAKVGVVNMTGVIYIAKILDLV